MRSVFKAFRSDRSGAIAVVGAVMMTALFAIIGFAITFVSANHEKTAYQKALDAAVLAAAGLPMSVSDDERIALAHAYFKSNLEKSGLLSSASATTINSTTSAGTFTMQEQTVVGTASASLKNHFSGFVGTETVSVVAKSSASAAATAPVCVLALDGVSPQGIEIYGTAQFTARNCASQANSVDGAGMRTYGSAIGRARMFGVTGGFTGTGFYPRPVTGTRPIFDPYAAIPVPPAGPCVDIASKLQHTPAVLTPGTYCGGIRIMANSTIIMEPGVYVMQDGPFRIDSNSTVDGSEVVIAFTGVDSTLYLGSGAILNLTSPTSGTYQNIQFFQDRNSNPEGWVTMLGDIRLTFDGVMYFPTQDVWIGGGSVINARSPTYIFVADKLWFQDNSIIEVWQEDSRGLGLATQSATISSGARLMH